METIAGKIIPMEFKNNSLIGFHLPPTNSQPHLHLHVVCPTSDLPQGQFIMGVLIHGMNIVIFGTHFVWRIQYEYTQTQEKRAPNMSMFI